MRFKALAAMLAFAAVLALLTGATDEPTPTEARIRLISMRGPLVGFGYLQDHEVVPVVIAPDFFSAEIMYRGPKRFELVPLPKPGPDGRPPRMPPRGRKDAPPPMAWFNLPPSGSEPTPLILFVTPGEEMEAMPDEPGVFPFGTVRVQNLCPYNIVVKLPNGMFGIEPNGSRVIRPPQNGGKGVEGAILTHEDGQERSGYAINFYPSTTRRNLWIITPGAKHSGLVLFRNIEDNYVEPPPPASRPNHVEEGGMPPARPDAPPPPLPGKNGKKR